MNDAALLQHIRQQAVLVNIELNTSGGREKAIEPGQRRDLVNAQTAILTAFEDRSIVFGKRRLVLASQFKDVVMVAGTARQRLNEMLRGVPDHLHDGFAVLLSYEPVPDGAGFKYLPPAFVEALSNACDRRQVEDYYDGMDQLANRAAENFQHFVDKLTEYDLYLAGTSAKAAVIRSVIVDKVQADIRLLCSYNIMQSDRYTRIGQIAGPVIDAQIDELRKNTEHRRSVLGAAIDILGLIAGQGEGQSDAGENTNDGG